MRAISERAYDLLFKIGVIAKGIISVGEIALGIVLYSVTLGTLTKAFVLLTGDELTEAPRDAFWTYVAHSFNGLLTTPQAFWAFLFLSHGLIKIVFVIGLMKNIRWIYPVSAVVFGLFAIYQSYQFIYTPSLLLALITIFDVLLIYLIMHEYLRAPSALLGGRR